MAGRAAPAAGARRGQRPVPPVRPGGGAGLFAGKDTAGCRRAALPAPDRDQLHLQASGQGAQSPQPDLRAHAGRCRPPFAAAGAGGQPAFRRPSHPGPGLPRPAGDDAGCLPRGRAHPGPCLDAVVRPVRLQVRFRPAGGLLRRPFLPHLRAGDGPFLGPGHEPHGQPAGRLRAHLQFRRPLRGQSGPRGQLLCGRALL